MIFINDRGLEFLRLNSLQTRPYEEQQQMPTSSLPKCETHCPKTEQPDAVVVLSESFPSRVDLYFY